MLVPFDDYPVHQTALPLAHAGGSHPDYYDGSTATPRTPTSPWARTGALLPLLGDGEPVTGGNGIRQVSVRQAVPWAPGLRRCEGASLVLGCPGGLRRWSWSRCSRSG